MNKSTADDVIDRDDESHSCFIHQTQTKNAKQTNNLKGQGICFTTFYDFSY